MYTPVYNKRRVLKFKQFNNHGYSLFSVLGKEVIIGVLSVATLRCADAAAQTTSVAVEPDTTWQRTVEMNEVNVTGTRAPLTVRQQARMVTVLSRSDIAAAPVQSVNDLLKYATGVDVRQKGPLGALTDVSIRGGNSEQVAILLNGINICDPQTGHNAMDLPVSLGEIERIEVLEGPAARVYGTSSLLGAINIVTRIDAKSGATAISRAAATATWRQGATATSVPNAGATNSQPPTCAATATSVARRDRSTATTARRRLSIKDNTTTPTWPCGGKQD